MKLTKRSALVATEKLWRKLENCNNEDGFGPSALKGQFVPDGKYVHNCPCCEYVCQTTGQTPGFNADACRYCPLIKLWPDTCVRGPYREWEHAISKGESGRRYAKQIADAAKRELKKL